MSQNHVTELATIKLNDQCDLASTRDALTKCFTLQDAWIAEHSPALARDNRRHTVVYADDAAIPKVLYFLASWNSAAHHYEWIASEENRQCGELLKPLLSTEPGAVALLHLDSASREPYFTDIVSDNVWYVTRCIVPPLKKTAMQERYKQVEGSQKTHICWAGWNAESPSETAEFVLFRTSQVPEESLKEVLDLSTSCERLTILPTTI